MDMEGWAFLVTDYGPESYLYFTLIMDNNEIWTFDNTKVRGCINKTLNRNNDSNFNRRSN
jgi:hypothetical protein